MFPTYPNPLAACLTESTFCTPPSTIASYLSSDVAGFSPSFVTPRVHQASLNVERELANRFAGGISYMFAHGQNLIRARDLNLPAPVDLTYSVYDESGTHFLGSYYTVPSFSTWHITRSMTCPYPPCVNPLARPIPQLGAINEFDSAASSLYHGVTVSLHSRIRMAYTFAHSIDDGQDALVVGRPATVQNSYSPASERYRPTSSVRLLGDRRTTALRPRSPLLSRLFNDWKLSGVPTIGSGRPSTRELQAIRIRTGTIRTIEFQDMDEMRFLGRIMQRRI